ncbi:hypothetical protein ECZU03_25490 [Escherichia coli]|nr:hypothetical protein ECZU03_25490 [Escherichia coli]
MVFLLLMNQRQQRVDRLAQAAVIIERMAILRSIAGGARQPALISLAFSRPRFSVRWRRISGETCKQMGSSAD